MSPATAWLTMSKANSGPAGGYVAGDWLLFKSGQTITGNLLWTTSGVQTGTCARCLIGNYGSGSLPNISCGDSYGIRVYDCEFVTVQNIQVTGSGVNSSTGATTSTSAGIDVFDDRTSGSKWRSVYVLGCTVMQCQSGITFRTPVPSDSPSAVVGYDDFRVVNCTVHDVQWYGINCIGGSTGWLNGPPNRQPNGVGVFTGGYYGYNTVYNVIGVSGQYAKPIEMLNCTGGFVERNLVRNSGVVQPPADNAAMMSGPADHIVYWCNEVKGMGFGIGIDLDSGSTNCQVIGNLVHDCDGACYMDFSGNVGANHLFANNIGCNDSLRSQETGVLFITGNGTFINNTIIADKNLQVVSGSALIAIGGSGAKPSFYNNILIARNGMALMTGTNNANLVGNQYFTPGGSFSLQVNGVTYTTFASLQAAGYEKSGGILYGVVGDPLLSNPPTAAFAVTLPGAQVSTVTFFDLTASSPARGAGVPPEVLQIFPPQRDFHGYPYRTGSPPEGTGGAVEIGAVTYGAGTLVCL